jgi:hypothetical protein
MSNYYYLNEGSNEISIMVEVETIGNASSIVTRKRTGGSYVVIAESESDASGSIPETDIGISKELIQSVIVVDTAVLLDGIPPGQYDKVFEDLRIKVTMEGGIDGEQRFNLKETEKKQFMDKTLIVASMAIKLTTQS